MYVRNPLVWLRRLGHSRGYGVHSPYAYDLLTQVIYSPGRYYDCVHLDRRLSRLSRLMEHRRIVVDRLLFRLSNRWQPRYVYAPEADSRELDYLMAGCRRARLITKPFATRPFLAYVKNPRKPLPLTMPVGSMLIVGRLSRNRKQWEAFLQGSKASITFDLYDVGIALFIKRYSRLDYVINW